MSAASPAYINISAIGQSKAEVQIKLSLDNIVRQIVDPDQIISWMNEVGQFGVRRAQSRVPFRTGELYQSIGYEARGARLSLYASAEHALPVEMGHRTASGSFVPARPFLRPAADEMFDYLERIVTRDLSKMKIEGGF